MMSIQLIRPAIEFHMQTTAICEWGWLSYAMTKQRNTQNNNDNKIWKRQNKASESKTHSPKQIRTLHMDTQKTACIRIISL